jgi:hypothetical protein
VFVRITLGLWALQGCVSGPVVSSPPAVDPIVTSRAAAGPARVLVELRVPADPSGVSPEPAAIARVQQRVLARLAGTRFTVIRRFESVPLIALEIHADALSALAQMSDLVTRVSEDSLAAPTRQGRP